MSSLLEKANQKAEATNLLKGHNKLGQDLDDKEEVTKPSKKIGNVKPKNISDANEHFKEDGSKKKIQVEAPEAYHDYLTDIAYKRNKSKKTHRKVTAKDILLESIRLHFENNEKSKNKG